VPVAADLRLVIVRFVVTAHRLPIAAPVLPMQSGLVRATVRHRVPMGTGRGLLIEAPARPLVIVRRRLSVLVASVPLTELIGIVPVTASDRVQAIAPRSATALLLPRHRNRLVSPHGVRIVAPGMIVPCVRSARFGKSVSCVKIVRHGSQQKLRASVRLRGCTAKSRHDLPTVTEVTHKLAKVDRSLGNRVPHVLSVLLLLAPVLVPRVVQIAALLAVLRVAMSLGVLRILGPLRRVASIVLVAIVLEPVALAAPRDRLIARDSLAVRRLIGVIVVLERVGLIVIVVLRLAAVGSLAVPVVLVPQLQGTPMPELIAVQTVALVLLVGMRPIPITQAQGLAPGSVRGGRSLVPVVKLAATVALALGCLVQRLQHHGATSGRVETVTVRPRQIVLVRQSLHGVPVVLAS
jgi:hypothetical protein